MKPLTKGFDVDGAQPVDAEMSVSDWRSLRKGGGLTLLQAAVECGFRGDVASLTNLMVSFQLDGLPPIAQSMEAFTVNIFVPEPPPGSGSKAAPVSGPGSAHQGLGLMKQVGGVSIAQAIGHALAREPEGAPAHVTEQDLTRHDRMHWAPQRTAPWRLEDEHLIRSAIAAFCAPGQLSKQSWHLFQSVARTASDPQALQAFVRAGALRGEMDHLLLPASHVGVERWKNEHLLARLGDTGRVQMLDWVLGRIDKDDHATSPILWKARDFTQMQLGTDRVIGHINMSMRQEEKDLASSGRDDRGLIDRPVARAALSVFANLAGLAVNPRASEPVEQAAMSLLAQHLDSLSDHKLAWHPEVVQAFLDSRPGVMFTVAEALEDWHTRQPAGSGLEDRAEHALIGSAVRNHCALVLRAAGPMLRATLPDGQYPMRSRFGAGWPWGCSDFSKPSETFSVPRWRATLEALGDAGFDVASSFLLKVKKSDPNQKNTKVTSLLHLLAESGHAQTIPALLESLDAGCDPKVKDGRNWSPAANVKDTDLRAQWNSAEKSFFARRAAQNALAGFIPQEHGADAHPLDEVAPSNQRGVRP